MNRGGQGWDRGVMRDDATNEHYDMRFVEEEGSAFVPWRGGPLDEILCEQLWREWKEFRHSPKRSDAAIHTAVQFSGTPKSSSRSSGLPRV